MAPELTTSARLSEATLEELQRRKNEMNANSIDEVLRRLTGLIPEPDFERLKAVLPPEIHDEAQALFERAQEYGEFELRTDPRDEDTERKGFDVIFTDPASGYEVVKAIFNRDAFKLAVRNENTDDEVIATIAVWADKGKVSYGTGQRTHEHLNYDDVLDNVDRFVPQMRDYWRQNT